MIGPVTFDHVAVAAERRSDTWARYGGDLPGAWLGGGTGFGFANHQIQFSTGMRLEVLEPAEVAANDFLRRFLDRNGPGPHHLTFKVADIERAIEAVQAAGYHPVGINTDYPDWKEMFFHPKEIPGIVVQLAESHGDEWRAERPAGFPEPRTASDAVLVRVVHAVPGLDESLRLFRDLLGGVPGGDGSDSDGDWLDLTWPTAGRLRLLVPSSPDAPLTDWIGNRSGRLHHLAFETDRPGDVAGAIPVSGGVWEVPPESNLGVRLRLHDTA